MRHEARPTQALDREATTTSQRGRRRLVRGHNQRRRRGRVGLRRAAGRSGRADPGTGRWIRPVLEEIEAREAARSRGGVALCSTGSSGSSENLARRRGTCAEGELGLGRHSRKQQGAGKVLDTGSGSWGARRCVRPSMASGKSLGRRHASICCKQREREVRNEGRRGREEGDGRGRTAWRGRRRG